MLAKRGQKERHGAHAQGEARVALRLRQQMKSEGKTMKKILFASTALIATASVAAADVSFGGYGRFGLLYVEDAPTETRLESRFRLNIDANAETDGGVGFSARIRMQADDNADGSAGTAGLNGARFTTQYEGFRVDVGNIAGVIDNLPGYYGFEPGLTAVNGQYSAVDFGFDGYSSTGAGENGVFAQYAVNNLAFSASYSQDLDVADTENFGVSFAYSGDTWTLALGYEQAKDDDLATDNKSDMFVATGQATFGAFSGVLFLGTESSDADPNKDTHDTFWGLSANYEVGAATDIIFAYGDGAATNDVQSFGLGLLHDLGGGVTIRTGIASEKAGSGDSTTKADLGVRFDF